LSKPTKRFAPLKVCAPPNANNKPVNYSLTFGVVLKEKFTAPVLHLNTSGLNSGLYLVKVQTAKGVVTEKVVVRR